MSFLQQTVIQLAVGLVAFIAGYFLQQLRATWSYFRSRRFWRPLLRRDLVFVLGEGFSGLRRFEASDVIGRGDLMASNELAAQLSQMGFGRMHPVFADRLVDDQAGRSLRRSMIVLGGPDANSVTDKFLASMNVSYKLVWPEGEGNGQRAGTASLTPPKLIQTEFAEESAEPYFQPGIEDDEVRHDYGVIIRAGNPFEPWGESREYERSRKRIVIMYGCYGYGTLAAVLYSQTRDFLGMVNNEKDDIECVVVCRVVMGTPQAIGCVYFKAHPAGRLTRRPGPPAGETW